MLGRQLFAALLLVAVAAPASAQFGSLVTEAERRPLPDNGPRGYWEAPFQHDLTGFTVPYRFNSLHMSLIPKGRHRGKVIVWDAGWNEPQPQWLQRWSIVDASTPGAPVFVNRELTMPANEGDFFCAGHAWTGDGNLFVAGGTGLYPTLEEHESDFFLGGRLAFQYDPAGGPNGTWHRMQDMEADRWYPTVKLLSNGQILVLGGVSDGSLPSRNDYEAFTPSLTSTPRGSWQINGSTQIFPGPQPPAAELYLYARAHQLFSGSLFISGMGSYSSKLDHANNPGVWQPTASSSYYYKDYMNSVLYPNFPGVLQDIVMIMGGEAYGGSSAGVRRTVEFNPAAALGPPDWDWIQGPSMKRQRMHANSVLLPDATVFVIGGRSDPGFELPEQAVRVPEMFYGGFWRDMAIHHSPRTYHSTAVLLPDGRVLSGGGDTATWDYQVYVPPYLQFGQARPSVTSAPATLEYFVDDPAPFTVNFEALPGDLAVAQVVLMAPGSVTHHTDYSQRYVQLIVSALTETSVEFFGPLDANWAPPGYYMLFLITNEGVPSVAEWVKIGP